MWARAWNSSWREWSTGAVCAVKLIKAGYRVGWGLDRVSLYFPEGHGPEGNEQVYTSSRGSNSQTVHQSLNLTAEQF